MDTLRRKLLKHKLALQPNKQPIIWQTICSSLVTHFDGDVRHLFARCSFSVREVRRFLTLNKKGFPYLSGEKISNYWFYVMQKYTDLSFVDRELITVAPDTHVIKASVMLGLITCEEANRTDVRAIVAERWFVLLKDTPYQAIDVHTPLWLWSRNNFPYI
jgi:hypothetical protein